MNWVTVDDVKAWIIEKCDYVPGETRTMKTLHQSFIWWTFDMKKLSRIGEVSFSKLLVQAGYEKRRDSRHHGGLTYFVGLVPRDR